MKANPSLSSGQVRALVRLWWRDMCRRPIRFGQGPKLSGAPTFVLLALVGLANTGLVMFGTVISDLKEDRAYFALHAFGSAMTAFGAGVVSGASTLKGQRSRGEAFLEALPISPAASFTLHIVSAYYSLPFALLLPLFGLRAYGPFSLGAIGPVLLGLLMYVASFAWGLTVVTWARMHSLVMTHRTSQLGTGLHAIGFATMLFPLGPFLDGAGEAAGLVTQWWLEERLGQLRLAIVSTLLLVLAWQSLRAADAVGFDRIDAVDAQHRSPTRKQSRSTAEWLMIWRQGGRTLVLVVSAVLFATTSTLVFHSASARRAEVLQLLTMVAVYIGALQTISLAGRSARTDLRVRSFLSSLPISSSDLLQAKSSPLRKLLFPVFTMLCVLAIAALASDKPSIAGNILLCGLALYIVAECAVSLAFLSSGLGIAGVSGGHSASSISTLLLLLPLLTIAVHRTWNAAVSCLTVAAVSWTARRAACMSIRWLDDEDDAIVRDTGVWRALLTLSSFFALQGLPLAVCLAAGMSPPYAVATTLLVSSLTLILLTWQNAGHLAFPRVLAKPRYWLLGALGGAASGTLGKWIVSSLSDDLPRELFQRAAEMQQTVVSFCLTILVVPLTEEYFFRGWLQRAIGEDLPASRKGWAFALGALAFALAHLGSSGVPQFVLGLIAGALYTRSGGLGPAVVAHMAHNGIVLFGSAL